VAGIDPEACRAAARERFSLARTIERYFALYHELAQSGRAAGPPRGRTAVRPRSMPDLEIEEITSSQRLEALAPAWHDLWRRAPAATPFRSPAWLIPWWQQIGDGELRVLAARAGDRLVGLLPLYRQPAVAGGKLLPLGIAISDYLDGLFEEGLELTAAEAMLRHLASREDWSRGELHPLCSGSPLLEARVPPCCTDEILEFEPCLVLPIPAQAREIGEVVPSRIRGKLRYFGRRAEQAGRVRFETATAATLSELLDALFCLHEARWRRLHGPGVLADQAIRDFHRAAAPLLLSAGLLRLHALRLDERIVAVVYALSARDRVYSYLSGFDPDLGAISPGTLTVGHAIRHAIGEGAREFDFLRGRERFKYLWGARERPCYGRMLDRVA
jgi:CelD/BcsL family acetyltransferase involved in cellulose biosynthesis